jgi:hypothetical protein
MCDASAVATVGNEFFLAANDEDNTLRMYRRDRGGAPVKSFKLDDYLEVTKKQAEADLEGAARIGNVVYWIASHGNNKDGEPRPNRLRFFATEFVNEGERLELKYVGSPIKGEILFALAGDPRLADCRWNEITALAPEQRGAVNIEGLAATPDGTLWIAFRNPVPQGLALLVELKNPRDVVEGKSPELGRIARLDLAGSGIRSIEYREATKSFLLVSGPFNDDGDFQLWNWSGAPEEAPHRLNLGPLADCTAEAVTFFPDRPGELFVLSDDGSRDVNGVPCKDTKKKDRHFRGGWVKLPAAD